MSFGYVIGNGQSRIGIPEKIWEGKDTWACNLAYRQFAPTNLVCCDKAMIIMALSESADDKSQLWTRSRWFTKLALKDTKPLPVPDIIVETKFDREMDWGSGTYAAYLACLSEHDILVFVGFDLWATKENRVNNVFAGEKGYGPKDAGPVGPEAWIHQFSRLFTKFPDKQFVFLNRQGWRSPDEWATATNVNYDSISALNGL